MITYNTILKNNLNPITTFNTLMSTLSQFTTTERSTIEKVIIEEFLLNPVFLTTLEEEIKATTHNTNTNNLQVIN